MIPLQAAWRTRDEWSRTLASLTAWTMSLTMDVELDWGPDEEWLTINKNGTWTGYLNADIPPSSAPTSSPAPAGPTRCK